MLEITKETAIGDAVRFGNYHGEIEWLVLDKKDNLFLLLSKNCLEAKPYNEEFVKTVWENCSLRKWLNEDFLESAFSEDERKMILEKKVLASDYLTQKTPRMNDTFDRVFVMSVEEAEKYFSSDEERRAFSSGYAKEKGLPTDKEGYTWWWLRTPAVTLHRFAFVNAEGYIYKPGKYCDIWNIGVRPAMWVETE